MKKFVSLKESAYGSKAGNQVTSSGMAYGTKSQMKPVLNRVIIVMLLTQDVVRDDFWVPTDGSPS